MKNQNNTKNLGGQFTTKDNSGVPVVIEWQKTGLFSPEFASTMKEAWEIAKQAYTPVEIQFLKTYPEVVGTETYFDSFKQLFERGIGAVDWNQAKTLMQSLLKSHFIFDATKYSTEIIDKFSKDDCFVVTVRDQKEKRMLGFITFLARATYTPGDIKVMALAVDPKYQNRGLGKLLMSSICKINPMVKRIFLCTRVTNETAIKLYKLWGFATDENPTMDHPFNMKHWVFMDYKLDKNNLLQSSSDGFRAVA